MSCSPRIWIQEALNLVRGTKRQLLALEELRRLASFADLKDLACEAERARQDRINDLKEERLKNARRYRRETKAQMMRELGMMKVHGALGGVYYE